MSQLRKFSFPIAVTVLASATAALVLWLGGGATSRDGWEANSWVSAAVAAYVVPPAAVWMQTLRRPAVEQHHWGWTDRVVRAEQVGVRGGRAVLGAFATRDRDAQLHGQVREAARAGGVVLVEGGSSVGKTRAAWEAVAALVPHRWLFVPTLGADLTTLPALVASKTRHGSVIWLDNVDKHLNLSTSLDHTLVQRLTRAGALVVMTVHTRAYDTYRQFAHEDTQIRNGPLDVGSQLLSSPDPVHLERLWSPEELERASRSRDTALAGAARRQAADGHGVTEYLAAAPELAALWHRAKDSAGTDGGNPRGYCVVAASVGLVQIGVEHASAELLEATHAHFALPAHVHPETFSEALTWAAKPQYGTCGLLIPTNTGKTHWRPFDHLVDITDSPIPEELWETALTFTNNPAVLESIGSAAFRAGLDVTAETAWRRAAETGHTDSVVLLGFLFLGKDNGKAEAWFLRAAEQGHTGAMHYSGQLLMRRGEFRKAEHWLRLCIEKGDTAATAHLEKALMKQGK